MTQFSRPVHKHGMELFEIWTNKWNWFEPPCWFIFIWAYHIHYVHSGSTIISDSHGNSRIHQKQKAGHGSTMTMIGSINIYGDEHDE